MQRHVAITSIETTVLLTLIGLLMLGTGVQHWRMQQLPPLLDDVAMLSTASDTARVDSTTAERLHSDPENTSSETETSDASPRSVDTTPLAAPPPPPVDINTADARALQTLSGIGPALSQRIITYRDAHGPFASVHDLQAVSGIGPRTVENIEARVVIGTINEEVSIPE